MSAINGLYHPDILVDQTLSSIVVLHILIIFLQRWGKGTPNYGVGLKKDKKKEDISPFFNFDIPSFISHDVNSNHI